MTGNGLFPIFAPVSDGRVPQYSRQGEPRYLQRGWSQDIQNY
jgi:hypothetical protein